MGVSAGTRTISDGLVLALDAANTRSYPGSGTTWTDLSGRGNNGTLTNGPSFVRPTFREPFGGAGSVYFDGSGDYLSLDATAGNAGTGNFTMEWWFLGSSIQINDNRSNHITTSSTDIYYQPVYGTNLLVFSNNFNDGSWHHHAVVRSSGVITYYIDGVSQASANYSSSVNSTTPFDIGRGFYGSMSGYVSNFRFVTSAVYTSNFTPKRESFVTQSSPYTSLLTCQNGTIRDASPNNFTITRVGNVTPVSYAPYISFDGTNDYVTVGSSPYTGFGTGDFTIEAWVYLTSNTVQNNGIYDCRYSASATGPLLYYIPTTGLLMFYNGSNTIIGGTISLNTWTHVAMIRLSGSTRLYINTVQVGSTYTDTNNYTSGVNNGVIGALYNGTGVWNGYMSTIKVYNGKGLTAAEVSQNYQNTKSRYGL